MTRVLSELLGAQEPTFSLDIQQLERASGRPSADIRLSNDIVQRTRAKIRELGLDPADTTGPELYTALLERFKADDQRVRQALNLADEARPLAIMRSVRHFIDQLDASTDCFALKHSVAKRLLKKVPPQRAMQALGYRSIDSFLKHEPVAQIYAAAWLSEFSQWRQSFLDHYQTLTPSDFEPRPIEVVLPTSKRWLELASRVTTTDKRESLSFKELGAILLLPIEANLPGLTLVTLLLTLHELNEIRCTSTYLKLQQVKPDFGQLVERAVTNEPEAVASFGGQPVPWRMLQRYYAANPSAYRPELFGPHVQAEDVQWHHAEAILAEVIPALEFWQDSAALGLLHGGQPVSLNLLDVALSYCNQLSFPERIVHFLRDNVWHELLLRYLHQDNVEQTVLSQVSNELVGEPAII